MQTGMHATLKAILAYCKDMRELLKQDIQSFRQNDLAHIETSNQKKTELLLKLTDLTNAASSERDARHEADLKHIASEIQTEIAECYKEIIKNSHIVSANLNQIKGIVDKLLACRSEMNCIYDNAGKSVRCTTI